MKLDNIKKIIVTLILTFLSMHVFILDIEIIDLSSSKAGSIYNFFQGLFLSIKPINFKYIIIFVLLYNFFSRTNFISNKKNIYFKSLSSIFAFITIMGIAYQTIDSSLKILFCSTLQIYKFLILFIGYSIIYYAIINKITNIDVNRIKIKTTKLEKIFTKHPILITSIILSIVFFTLAIIYYPGGATGDTADSVYQFFHSENSWTIQSINLKNENIYINKHHSVLFTIMLGSLLKIGNYIHLYNFGFFLFILFQLSIIIVTFTFMIYYMKKIQIPFYLILLSFLFVCFSPIVIKYSLTAVKDTLSSVFTLLYVIFLFQIVKNYNSIFKKKFRLLIFVIIMLIIMMLRNNGIFTIIFSFPFLLLLYKNKWKKLSKILIFILMIFFMYDRLLLPSFDISNGSIKEIMSIPFMQIARVAKYHTEDFTEEEQYKINEVLDFNNIVNNYNPKIADDVKDTYKKTATTQELLDFFKIWFKYLKKYPFIYVDSFLNSTYGYFYPPFIEDEPKILFSNFLAYDEMLNLGPISKFNNARAIINYLLCYIYYHPFFTYFYSVGIIDFILILSFIYIIRKKKYKYLIPLTPLMSVLLVCLASPVNGCARYILPIIFTTPIILSIDYFVYRENKLEKEKNY